MSVCVCRPAQTRVKTKQIALKERQTMQSANRPLRRTSRARAYHDMRTEDERTRGVGAREQQKRSRGGPQSHPFSPLPYVRPVALSRPCRVVRNQTVGSTRGFKRALGGPRGRASDRNKHQRARARPLTRHFGQGHRGSWLEEQGTGESR